MVKCYFLTVNGDFADLNVCTYNNKPSNLSGPIIKAYYRDGKIVCMYLYNNNIKDVRHKF